MSSSSKQSKNSSRRETTRADVEKGRSVDPPASYAKASGGSSEGMALSDVLSELKKIRRENQDGHSQTKASLDRLELSVEDLKGQIKNHEGRLNEAEKRIGEAEDKGMRHGRALRYLLHRDMVLTARCEDLQNRLRRNNLRIYQVPEDSEGRDMVKFVKDLICGALQESPGAELKIERAHRAPVPKPSDHKAPPRSIIVRFLDFTTKETVLRLAWGQKRTVFQNNPIYFDHDYSPDLQRKRARVRYVIKQLKTKGIRAKCPYPAQLRISLDTGEKTFSTLIDATPTLKELGIEVRVDERERLEKELRDDAWTQTRGARGGEVSLSLPDYSALCKETSN